MKNALARGNKEVNGGRTIEINSQFIGHSTDKIDAFDLFERKKVSFKQYKCGQTVHQFENNQEHT